VGDVVVELPHQALDEADVLPARRKCAGNHLVHLGVNRIGGGQSCTHRAGRGVGIVKTPATAMGDDVHQFIMGQGFQFGHSELGQQGCAGGSQDLGEGLDPLSNRWP